MTSELVRIPELERGIERHGIERVSPQTRAHVRIFDNLTMWLSANLVISTVALGALAGSLFNLGFWDSAVAIILFNVLGVLPVAFFSTLGPKLGLRQMTISRFSFGWTGAIMELFNVAACIGWSAVNVIVGGQLVASLSSGAVPEQVGILVVAVVTTVVSIYGYKYVHGYQRYAWIPMAIIFAILFWLTFLGVAIPCILLQLLGMAFTTVAAYQNKGGGDLLAAVVQPLGGFGTFLLVLLALSVIANNIPNDYSLGLSMQVLGRSFQRVNRAVWTFIGAVIYIIIAIIGAANFNVTLENF